MIRVKKQHIRIYSIVRSAIFFKAAALLALVLMVTIGCQKKEEISSDVDRFISESVPEGGVHRLTIEGVISFDQAVDDSLVNRVLRDVYLKYIRVEFTGVNKLGKYEGLLDSNSHPEVDKFVYGPDIQENDDFKRFKQFCSVLSYYYKIRCDSMRIASEKGAPFYYTGISDYFTVRTEKYDGADELARQNHVVTVMVDLFLFEKLGKYHLHKFVNF